MRIYLKIFYWRSFISNCFTDIHIDRYIHFTETFHQNRCHNISTKKYSTNIMKRKFWQMNNYTNLSSQHWTFRKKKLSLFHLSQKLKWFLKPESKNKYEETNLNNSSYFLQSSKTTNDINLFNCRLWLNSKHYDLLKFVLSSSLSEYLTASPPRHHIKCLSR